MPQSLREYLIEGKKQKKKNAVASFVKSLGRHPNVGYAPHFLKNSVGITDTGARQMEAVSKTPELKFKPGQPEAHDDVNEPGQPARYDVGAHYDAPPAIANKTRQADLKKNIDAAHQDASQAPTVGAKQAAEVRADSASRTLKRVPDIKESEMVNSEKELVQQKIGQFKAETRGRMLTPEEWRTLQALSARLTACQANEQALGTGGYSTGAPEYKTGKSPMTEAMAPQPRGSVVTGKSNYDKWTKQAAKQKPITKNSKTYFGITEKDKDFPELGEIREGEVTGSEGSLWGGPTGSIGEDGPTNVFSIPKSGKPSLWKKKLPPATWNKPKPVKESDLGQTAGVAGQSSPVNFTQFTERSKKTGDCPMSEIATWGVDVGSAFEDAPVKASTAVTNKMLQQNTKVENGITYYKIYNGKGQPVWTHVPPRPQDEDTEGLMQSGITNEAAGVPTRNKFFTQLVQTHKNLPARYRDSGDDLTAESTDKMTLQTIATFAHQTGLRTSIKKSVYEWDETWVLTITGFRG